MFGSVRRFLMGLQRVKAAQSSSDPHHLTQIPVNMQVSGAGSDWHRPREGQTGTAVLRAKANTRYWPDPSRFGQLTDSPLGLNYCGPRHGSSRCIVSVCVRACDRFQPVSVCVCITTAERVRTACVLLRECIIHVSLPLNVCLLPGETDEQSWASNGADLQQSWWGRQGYLKNTLIHFLTLWLCASEQPSCHSVK